MTDAQQARQAASVRVADLVQRAGRRSVLNGLTFSLYNGVTALLGPNGAGKTTLLRTLATVEFPISGSISLLGFDPSIRKDLGKIRTRLGYLPQTLDFYPSFSVGDFVRYIGLLKGVPLAEIEARAKKSITEVGLSSERNTRLGALSGGMLRRAGIAQALVNDPGLLVLDEPTAGLDPRQRASFRSVIAAAASNRTVVLSTHLIEDVVLLATQIIVMADGRILFDGSPQGLAGSGGSTSPVALESLSAGYDMILHGAGIA